MSANFLENEIISETENKEISTSDKVIIHNESDISNKSENNTEVSNLKDVAEKNIEINENLDDTNPPNSKSDEKSEEPSNKTNDWLDILGSGGILKKSIVEGKPDTRPTRGEKCTINYTCSLEDGTITESKSDYQFFLGESDVSSTYIIVKLK